VHRDHLFWPLLTSPPADRAGVALNPSLNPIPNHSLFCFIFSNLSHGSRFWISTQLIQWSKTFQWGFIGGWERVGWGLPLLTLNQPSTNPQATLSQPPMSTEQIQSEFGGYDVEKEPQLHACFLWNVKFS